MFNPYTNSTIDSGNFRDDVRTFLSGSTCAREIVFRNGVRLSFKYKFWGFFIRHAWCRSSLDPCDRICPPRRQSGSWVEGFRPSLWETKIYFSAPQYSISLERLSLIFTRNFHFVEIRNEVFSSNHRLLKLRTVNSRSRILELGLQIWTFLPILFVLSTF